MNQVKNIVPIQTLNGQKKKKKPKERSPLHSKWDIEHTSSIPKSQVDNTPINGNISTEVVKHSGYIVLPNRSTKRTNKTISQHFSGEYSSKMQKTEDHIEYTEHPFADV